VRFTLTETEPAGADTAWANSPSRAQEAPAGGVPRRRAPRCHPLPLRPVRRPVDGSAVSA
jgi:hypothetical protein